MEFREFQYNIHQLTSGKKFDEALHFFKENKHFFLKEQIAGNVYLVSDMLTSLRKKGAFEAAGRFLEIYGITIDQNTNERILTGWTLVWYDYYKSKDYISPADEFWNRLLPAMQQLTRIQSEFVINIYNIIANQLLRTESHRNSYPAALIKRICESIDPEFLHKRGYEVTVEIKGNEKHKELASAQEDWYSQYSKSLFLTEQYEKCIEICNSAFEKIDKMHYSNEIWFSRRIAQCMGKMGKTEEAIRSFEKLTRKKGDWFMIAELASLYKQAGKTEEAINLSHKAMTLPGELKFKIELIAQIAELYELKNEKQLADSHRELLWLIQKSEQWKTDPLLTREYGRDCSAEEANQLRMQLTKKLRVCWTDTTQAQNVNGEKKSGVPVFKTGIITSTGQPKEQGTDIWISADDGEKIYGFIKKENPLFGQIKRGLAIQFQVLPGRNGKLNVADKITTNTK
jgi:tetratricopeptide (TPR) repeat protein